MKARGIRPGPDVTFSPQGRPAEKVMQKAFAEQVALISKPD